MENRSRTLVCIQYFLSTCVRLNDACRMEHTISEESFQKIQELVKKIKKKIHQRNKWKNNGNAIKSVVRSFVRQLSCCQISDILNSKSQKQVCQKDRCCPSAKKKDIQLQNLPISKMNCADSTERPLKLPEPVFHCVDIFHHQPDNIDVPSRIPAHEELSGCF